MTSDCSDDNDMTESIDSVVGRRENEASKDRFALHRSQDETRNANIAQDGSKADDSSVSPTTQREQSATLDPEEGTVAPAIHQDNNTDSACSSQDQLDDQVSDNHPMQGKLVLVKSGKFEGITARVSRVRHRGWLELDHAAARGRRVSSQFCHFLDELTMEEMEAYYKETGKIFNVTPSLKALIRSSGKSLTSAEQEETKKRPAGSNDSQSDNPPPKKKRATGQAPNSDMYSHSAIRLKGLTDSARERLLASNIQPMNDQCEDGSEMMNYECLDRRPQRVPRPLPPILLQTNNPNQLLPSLGRFDPDARIDIFDRRTGKIISGEDAIRIRDLPRALLMHAEYEPIIPPLADQPSARNEFTPREGRSAPKVRVSQSVKPQSQSQTMNKGMTVVVTKGPYRGYIGEIGTQTPGGWYIINRVRDKNEDLGFPLVVEPQHIDVISNTSNRSSNSTEIARGSDKATSDTMEDFMSTFEGFLAEHHCGLVNTLKERIKELSNEEGSLVRALEHCRRHRSTGGFVDDEKKISSRLRTVSSLRSNVEDELEFEMDLAATNRMQGLTGHKATSQFASPAPEEASAESTTPEAESIAVSSKGAVEDLICREEFVDIPSE